MPGATRGAGIVTPPRDANGIPGTPPLTTYGKSVFAWDSQQGTRPGGKAGNVLLNAHTWPDGSALGNRLLAALHRGRPGGRPGRRRPALLQGHRAGRGAGGHPDVPLLRPEGPARLAILVCSGTRLGPGVWTKRTVWFASPVQPS